MVDLNLSEQEEPDIRGLTRNQQQQPQPQQQQPQQHQQQKVELGSDRGQARGRSDERAIRSNSSYTPDHHPSTSFTSVTSTSTLTPDPVNEQLGDDQPSEHHHHHAHHPNDRATWVHQTSIVPGDEHERGRQRQPQPQPQPQQQQDELGVVKVAIEGVETGMKRMEKEEGFVSNSHDHQSQHERHHPQPRTGIHSDDDKVDPLSPMPYHRFRSQFGSQRPRPSTTGSHPPSTLASQPHNGSGTGGLLGIGGILNPKSSSTKYSHSGGTNDLHARFGLLCEPRGSPNYHHHNQLGSGGGGVAGGGGTGEKTPPMGNPTPPPPIVLENIGPIRPTKSIAELFTPGRKLGNEPGWKESGWNTLKSSYLVYLLPLVPVAWALHLSHQQPVIVFVFTFLAIIPLASLLSFATEQLALRMGDALGGLLNATFGNAVELLISILALVKGEIGLVQASMIGSILSNTLLVLGFCFFCGGLRFHEQIYSTSASQLQISLLGIAMCALVLPAAFQFSLSSLSTSTVIQPVEEITDLDSRTRSMLLSISRGTSFMLLSTYAVYLVFQLYTHAYLFKRRPQAIKRPHLEPGAPRPNHAKVLPISEWVAAVRSRGSASSSSDGLTPTTTRDTMHMTTAMTEGATSTAVDLELGGGGSIRDTRSVLEFARDVDRDDDEDEDEEIPLVKAFFALGLLLVVTGITGVTAEFLVDSIDGVTESTSISREFVGLVLLPIVGNIPETVCAITVSVKDKLDLALSIAVGSTIQVALGLLPLLVLVGWAIGQPMSLFFDTFQIISLAVSLIIVAFAISDGRSCFAEGYILIMTYLIFALCSWYYDPSLVTDQQPPHVSSDPRCIFQLERGRGALKVAGSNHNLCLDYGSEPRDGTLAVFQTCNGGPSQDFYYTGPGDDHIAITGGTLCLDLRREDGRTLQYWQCGTNPQQVFTF